MPDGVARQAYGEHRSQVPPAAIRRDVRQNAKEALLHHNRTGRMLYGLCARNLQGAIVTLERPFRGAGRALLVSLARGRSFRKPRNGLILKGTPPRSAVPDLGINALPIFYGLQIALNVVTDLRWVSTR